jgi:hypothetical protein
VKEVIITRRLGRTANPVKMMASLTGVDQSLVSVSFDVAFSRTVISSPMLGTLSEAGAAVAFVSVSGMVGIAIGVSICP